MKNTFAILARALVVTILIPISLFAQSKLEPLKGAEQKMPLNSARQPAPVPNKGLSLYVTGARQEVAQKGDSASTAPKSEEAGSKEASSTDSKSSDTGSSEKSDAVASTVDPKAPATPVSTKYAVQAVPTIPAASKKGSGKQPPARRIGYSQSMYLLGSKASAPTKVAEGDIKSAITYAATESTGDSKVQTSSVSTSNLALRSVATTSTGVMLNDSQPIEFKVLASEITAGEKGDPIPVRASYQIGEGARVQLFDGQPVAVGGVLNIPPPLETEELTFFAQADGISEVASTDPEYCIILTNGSNLANLMAEKGIHASFGGQTPVTEILRDFLLPNGEIVLPSNKTIMLMELGGVVNDPAQNPAYDMNDLVVLITTPTEAASTIVLKDLIGPNTDATNGQVGQTSGLQSIDSIHRTAAARFTPMVPVKLAQFQQVGYKFVDDFDLNGVIWTVKIWDSMAAALGSQVYGNFYHSDLAPGIVHAEPFGVGPSSALGGITYLLTLDLAALDIPALTAGHEYVIGLVAHGPSSNTWKTSRSGIWHLGFGIDPPDYWLPSTVAGIPLVQSATVPGQFGVRISGIDLSQQEAAP